MKHSAVHSVIWILCAGGACLLMGCSSFQRDWKTAQANPIPAQSMAGPWDGEWRSEVNGHHGRLRCLMSPLSDEAWQARFHAKYKILKFIPVAYGYTVELSGTQTNGHYTFQGEEDLGKLAGGVYRYEGKATAEEFFSTYRCRYDHGTFHMHRPERAEGE